MSSKISIFWNRVGIVLTLISLICIVLIFEYGKISGWSNMLRVFELVLFIILILSFSFSYIKTGLWGFAHRSLTELDEREIALISKSLRYAYAIFSITVLCLLLFLALTSKTVTIVTATSFILFAHLIPASIIGWTERR